MSISADEVTNIICFPCSKNAEREIRYPPERENDREQIKKHVLNIASLNSNGTGALLLFGWLIRYLVIETRRLPVSKTTLALTGLLQDLSFLILEVIDEPKTVSKGAKE